MLTTTYRERASRSALNRLRLSGRLGGVLSLVFGCLFVAVVFLPYAAGKVGLIEISDRADPAESSLPPDWEFLSWLDDRPSTRSKSPLGDPDRFFENAGSTKRKTGGEFHPFGTDSAGRDLLQLIILGADNAFLPGFYSVILSIGLGSLFGVLWGYYGGWRGSIVEALIKIVHSIPMLFVLLVVGAATNFGIYAIMTALGVLTFPKIAELIRERILSLKKQEFITAAREVGMSDLTILRKHILWYNCRHILFIQATFGMANAVLMETTLSYLRFGAQGISWGRIVDTGKEHLFAGMLWMSVLPALTIALVIFGFCLIGDGLSRIFKLKAH